MQLIFKPGDVKSHQFQVAQADIAQFHSEVVHPVCSTFALAREIEWSSRLFVLDMLEEGEEGIGTFLEIAHRSPALVGDTLIIVATVERIDINELMCLVEVTCAGRVIATGRTGQKIENRDRFTKNLSR